MSNKNMISVTLVSTVIAGLWFYPSNSSDPNTGAPIVNVKIPSDLEQVAEGKLAFDEFCVACHGKNASGSNGNGPPLIHKIYEPGHHGDMSFILAVKNGTRAHHWKFGNMPPVEGVSEEKVKRIIDYVRKLQRANGIN